MKKEILFLAFAFTFILLSLALGFADEAATAVCCEKTTNNLYCQNVPANECSPGSRQAPTSCASTSFCKPGVCYSPLEGTCMENTPQIVCNARNATWSADRPAQCELGCCVLGDQAAFVSLVRCKRLASFLGLSVNYNKQIKDEVSCVLSVKNQDKGACVYEFEFEKTCKFTTREECGAGTGLNGTGKGTFYKDKLCSAPELGTICERTTKTSCIPGKEEVYFTDSCGNPANVYDSQKLNDNAYWSNVIKPEDSCNANSNNADSKSCGNCNYLLGSICREVSRGSKPTYGDFKCVNLNCPSTSAGAKKHGESWCVYDDKGEKGKGKNSVGSRFYKHLCINGKELVEQCADFRNEECIQDSIKTNVGDFTQAACRVNRWQDCLSQTEQKDCENRDKRDCLWRVGVSLGNSSGGACLPLNPPGLKFWEGEETKQICAQGNTQCNVIYEKSILGGESIKSGKECLDNSWLQQKIGVCNALGDCGSNINWLGQAGYREGYKITGP